MKKFMKIKIEKF